MIAGRRIIIRDKAALREAEGTLRQIGNPMDILRNLPEEVKILHVVDLNARTGNVTNFDLYDHMTYRLNIEVECAPRETLVKKLLSLGARAVLGLPCALELEKFENSKRLLVGKVSGKERDGRVYDYYLESEDIKEVKGLAKEGKRVLLHSKTISEKDAEKAGVFALIRDV